MRHRRIPLSLVFLLLFAGCSTLPPIPDTRIADVAGQHLEYATAGAGRPVIVFIHGGGPADME